MNRSAEDGEWSSLHYGGEGIGFHPIVPRCLRATRWGRGACDPGRPGIVQAAGRACQEVGADISESEVPAEAVPGVGSGRGTQERGCSKRPRIAAESSGAGVLKRHIRGGRPRAWLRVGDAGKR
jgi:hypothetical protein